MPVNEKVIDGESFEEQRAKFVQALENMRTYLEFAADRSNVQESEYYLALRNYLEVTIRELQSQQKHTRN